MLLPTLVAFYYFFVFSLQLMVCWVDFSCFFVVKYNQSNEAICTLTFQLTINNNTDNRRSFFILLFFLLQIVLHIRFFFSQFSDSFICNTKQLFMVEIYSSTLNWCTHTMTRSSAHTNSLVRSLWLFLLLFLLLSMTTMIRQKRTITFWRKQPKITENNQN